MPRTNPALVLLFAGSLLLGACTEDDPAASEAALPKDADAAVQPDSNPVEADETPNEPAGDMGEGEPAVPDDDTDEPSGSQDAGVDPGDPGTGAEQGAGEDAGAGEEPPGQSPGTVTCATVRCEQGYRCEMVEVECFAPPCDPVAQCVEDVDAGSEEPCGPNICPSGMVCCNSLTGVCTEPGGFCTF